MDVFVYKTDAMRQLQNLISRGYTRWVSGQVSPKKLEAMVLKFDDRYQISRTHQQRYRAKLKGLANCHLVLWQSADDVIEWWLVVTAGEGLVVDLEQLKDATGKRDRITLTGYELVKVPRQKREAAWSWRMTAETYSTWQERIKVAVRNHNDELLRQAIHSLKRVPAFAESRRQAFDLALFMKGNWKRAQKGEWPYGDIYVGWFGKFQSAKKVDARELSQSAKKIKPVLS